MGCSDSVWSIPTAVSLLDHGDATLDEYQPLLESRGRARTEELHGATYSIYPIGTSLIVIPAVIVLRPVAAAAARHAPAVWAWLERAQAEGGCQPAPGEPIV